MKYVHRWRGYSHKETQHYLRQQKKIQHRTISPDSLNDSPNNTISEIRNVNLKSLLLLVCYTDVSGSVKSEFTDSRKTAQETEGKMHLPRKKN